MPQVDELHIDWLVVCISIPSPDDTQAMVPLQAPRLESSFIGSTRSGSPPVVLDSTEAVCPSGLKNRPA